MLSDVSGQAGSVQRCLEKYILPFGLFVLLLRLYLFPSRNAYKTSVYLAFILPSLVYLLLYGRQLAKTYFSGSALLFLLTTLLIALSTLWGDTAEFADSLKRATLVAIAGFGIFVCVARQPELFKQLLAAAVLVVSFISLVWIADYYFLLDFSLDRRFLASVVSSIGFYEKDHYAGFYNPLLFGHVQGFFCVVALVVVNWELSSTRGKLLYGIAVMPLFALLILAQARTSLGAVFVCLLCCMVIRGWSSYRARVAGGVLLFIMAVSTFILWDFLSKRGLSYRPYIWEQSWGMIQEAFWFGHGWGGTILIEFPNKAGRYWNDTHNLFLAIWYFSGFVAVGLFVAFVIQSLYESNTIEVASPWYWVLMCYVFVENMTDGGGLVSRPNEHWFAWYLPCLLIAAYGRVTINKKKGVLKK